MTDGQSTDFYLIEGKGNKVYVNCGWGSELIAYNLQEFFAREYIEMVIYNKMQSNQKLDDQENTYLNYYNN